MWLLLSPAFAQPLTDGERLEWAVSWMGIEAGRTWATLRETTGGWAIEAGCRSHDWLAALYPIDDWLLSEPGRYRTRFREGRFHQDQDMSLGDPFVVARSQLVDGAWKSGENRYDAVPDAEDPVSAFYRVSETAAEPGGEARFPVWTGRRGATVVAHTSAREEGRLRVDVHSGEDGEDVRDAMTVWLSDDADRVPVEVRIQTRAGPVYARLVERTVTP